MKNYSENENKKRQNQSRILACEYINGPKFHNAALYFCYSALQGNTHNDNQKKRYEEPGSHIIKVGETFSQHCHPLSYLLLNLLNQNFSDLGSRGTLDVQRFKKRLAKSWKDQSEVVRWGSIKAFSVWSVWKTGLMPVFLFLKQQNSKGDKGYFSAACAPNERIWSGGTLQKTAKRKKASIHW